MSESDRPRVYSTILLCLSNVLPLVAGLCFFPIFVYDLSANYITFTISYWVIFVWSMFYFAGSHIENAINSINRDFYAPEKTRICVGFAWILFFLFLLNIDWLPHSRSMGLDVRSLRFKIFFLFEDVLFLTYIVFFCRMILSVSFRRLFLLALFAFFLIMVFGRFGLLIGQLVAMIVLGRQLISGGIKKFAILSLIASSTIIGIYAIEAYRASEVSTQALDTAGAAENFVDRIGEFGTLRIVDDVFSSSQFVGFSGFENLSYLYLPSIFFDLKPIIDDGASYLAQNFGLGSSNDQEAETRFPIMLHVDSYKRFGWFGLLVALVPSILIRINLMLFSAFRRLTGAPFLDLIIFKNAVFIYPKAVLGMIQLFLYTTIRSATVVLILVFLMKSISGKRRIS